MPSKYNNAGKTSAIHAHKSQLVTISLYTAVIYHHFTRKRTTLNIYFPIFSGSTPRPYVDHNV